jgi:DNA-binding MarR family transcriptional regulator
MGKPQGDPDAARAVALAGELRALLGQLVRRLRESTRPKGLTPSQASALARLEREGPVTLTTLARAEGVRSQSMGATVAALETAGLVSRAPDPVDGRQTILSPTAAGRELIRDGRAARQDWLFRAIRATLTTREQKELGSAVELLKRLVDSTPDSR